MTTTMNLIAKQTVGSGGASSVTFSNIPQTFTDLKIVISARGTTSGTSESIRILPNGSSTSLTFRQLQGTGSAAFSGTGTYWYLGEMPAATATSSTFGSAEVYIPNYTSANNKSASSDNAHENNTSTAYLNLNALLWSNTAAITSLVIQPNSNNFVEFSEFYLYGISNSSTQNTSVPIASGGDVIATDGSYWYHAFKYSGSFTPLADLSADVLVVAGGGGAGYPGGAGGAGGGGAGGLLAFSAQSLTSATNYSCVIGAGGAAVTAEAGTTGGDSQFSSLTLVKGGGGGGRDSSTVGNERYMGGKTGGSGGGGGINADNSTTPPAGLATSGQGNNGGTGFGGFGSGAGGGGAGAVGANTVSQKIAGAGGAGVNTYSSWASATSTGASGYFAGGGGGGAGPSSTTTGGAGGAGGGGNGGGDNQSSTAGSANTGGGGGAGGYPSGGNGQNGGSGIVIIRYGVA